jgi:2-polyprenyl-3-methyl-5-hydroxy-6-metoxy-1,4-benzoquinol methylase
MDDRDLFYENMASEHAWDDVANTHETQRRLTLVFDRLLKDVDLSGKKFLDAGCGAGHFSARAVARGADVTSLDVGESLLAQVATRCRSRQIVGSVCDLPFDDGTFEFVLSTEVIEHTPDPLIAIDQVCRVVGAGGTLVLTTPCKLWQPVVRAASWCRLRPFQGRENFVWPRQAIQRVTAAGLTVEQVAGFNILPLFSRSFEPLLACGDVAGKWLPWGFVNFCLVARRLNDRPRHVASKPHIRAGASSTKR